MTTQTKTTTEDSALLKHTGLMGHEFVAISGATTERRVRGEFNDVASARHYCESDTLVIYRRTAKKTWVLSE